MRKSTAFERQVRRIYELIAESGSEVTWNDHIGDPDNPPRTRQIDVTVRRNGALTLVECRLRKVPQDVQWIECLIGRRISLGAQSVIAVSSSGFTYGALAKARQYGIITRDLQRLTDKEVESWGQRIELILYYYQYSDLEVSLGFSPESIPTTKIDELKAELRWHPCVQSLFNAAAKKLTDANLMSGPLQGQKVNFGVDIELTAYVSVARNLNEPHYKAVPNWLQLKPMPHLSMLMGNRTQLRLNVKPWSKTFAVSAIRRLHTPATESRRSSTYRK
jgi:hypothetical protein